MPLFISFSLFDSDDEVFDSDEATIVVVTGAFLASNVKNIPVECKSQSSGLYDDSATATELQSGFRVLRPACRLEFSF